MMMVWEVIISIKIFLTEIDFKKVLQDYEHLKANHLLRKEFPRILMSKFSAVFYPSINMIERPATYSDDPNVLIEVDPKNLSSLPGQTHSGKYRERVTETWY